MMKLQTNIPLHPEEKQIDYDSKVLLLGSCFSENIGSKLTYYQFRNLQNPFGFLFHPEAIARIITNSIHNKQYTEKDIFYLNDQWHSYDAHSILSSTKKEDTISNLNKAIQTTHQKLLNASHIIITLGTAWGYRHKKTNELVANCHKAAQCKFSKELSPIKEITTSLKKSIKGIQAININAKILFTISPVRHLKDGFIENQRSKSHLIAAVHQLINPSNNIFYFPAYEIMMDELRDYRFYKEDMIHPSTIAINYIWEKFKHVWITSHIYSMMDDIETVRKGLAHRPINPNSEQHKTFLQNIKNKTKELQEKYPFMVF
ncbi:GSCFA domain-containing protein [Leptobacterium sp. I13]|uniref:GSCFA domain-containing protein n=1 Tax=Leptobacterium meishanense TaxID=3128904 RepID=UPI0030EF534B